MARHRTVVRSTKKHNNAWGALAAGGGFVAVAASTKVLVGTVALSNPNIDETILRVVGMLAVVSDQTAAVEQQLGACGLIIVSDQAITAGAASIPGPNTDADHDGWFCHTFFVQQQEEAANLGSRLYDFVSKGRRIVQEGEQIAIMFENGHATHGLEFELAFRILSRVTGT